MPFSGTLSEADRAEMKRLHVAGVPIMQIAIKFACSTNAVRYHVLPRKATKRTNGKKS